MQRLVCVNILDFGYNDPIEWKGSDNSQVWSMTKKRWMIGPALMKDYYALNACALALNSSAVLVIGLIKALDFSASYPKDEDGLFPNTVTSIYNFETKRWILQDSIHYNTSKDWTLLQEPVHFNLFPPFKYVYSFTCQIIPDKKWNRYVCIHD